MFIRIEDSKGNEMCQFVAEIDMYYYNMDCHPILNLKDCKIVDRHEDHDKLQYVTIQLDGKYEKKIDDEYNLRVAMAYHDVRPKHFDKDYK